VVWVRPVALVIVLALVGSVGPAAHAVAGRSMVSAAAAVRSLRVDFNNDGADDLAVGAPGEDVGSAVDAGAVTVLYGSTGGLTSIGSQQFTQPVSAVETDDQFGAALASGDVNGDGFADLVVGAPFEDVGRTVDAGAVSVLYGSAGGLTTTGGQTFVQVGGAVEAGDQFGAALGAGDFDNDGVSDVAAGAPFEDVGTIPDAGAVGVLYGSAGGLTTTGGQAFTQPVSAIEVDDVFGFAVAAGDVDRDGFADLAAGAPFEDVGRTFNGGAVSVLYGSAGGLTTAGAQTFTQPVNVEELDEFGLAVAAGDFDQDGFADVAVGAPFEDVGTIATAGAVNVLYGSAGGLTTAGAQTFVQPAGVEEGDGFGFAVATGDFNQDGFADLAAGAPEENVASTADAGSVSALYGSAGRLTTTGAQTFTQVGSAAEVFDQFGFAVATGDFDQDGFADLAAGAPFEDVGTIATAGAVSALYGSTGRLSASDGQLFHQDSAGVPGAAEAGDFFGAGLAVNDASAAQAPSSAPSPSREWSGRR
jgi:hypothetical protein